MKNTKKLVLTALFAALICLLTMFPLVNLPNQGYIHLGDGLIITAAFFIGIYSVPAAAVGSCLADLILGAFNYSPATFIIKGLMALAAYVIIKRKPDLPGFISGAVAAEIIMIGGYFLYDTLLYGVAFAAGNVLLGLIQVAGGIVIGVSVSIVIKKLNLKEKMFDK
jgi:uncharacterized membrane protein